jgi:fission process protein 1
MLFPAYAVHTVVHQATHFLKNRKATISPTLYRYGPTGLGLAIIPMLPVVFDHPTEYVVEKAFEFVWPLSATGKKAIEEHRKEQGQHGHHHKHE